MDSNKKYKITLNDLPNELLEKIFSYLPIFTIDGVLKTVCRRFESICNRIIPNLNKRDEREDAIKESILNLKLDEVYKHRYLLEDKNKKPFLRHSNYPQMRRWRNSDLTEDEEAKRREEDIYHRRDTINGIDLSCRTPRHFDTRDTGRIHASNIKYEVIDEDLKTLFGKFGRLKRAAVNYNPYGRSNGTAFIVFESKYSAVKAFEALDGKLLDGRILKLKLLNYSGEGCRQPHEVFKRKGEKRPVDGVNVFENNESIRPEDLDNMGLDDYIQIRKRAKTWNYY